MKNLITKTLALTGNNTSDKKEEIKNYFLKTWEIDELLYSQLKSDDVFYHRGDPLRHVILFYLGHTAVFFINKLFLAKIIDERINPSFESIFAIGVDEMSWDDLDERHYAWPAVSEVYEYRNKAKEIILSTIDQTPLTFPINWENPFWIILMGIEHERIHLETSSVLIRQLPVEEVVKGTFGEICKETGQPPKNEFIHVEGAEMKLGKPWNHPLYGWDNEYGNHTEKVNDFSASKFLVSNADFFSFVQNNGYTTPEFWTEEGWNWRNFKNAEMPLFWRKAGSGFKLRLVAEEIDMPWNWPVEVNYLEAKAYCNWLSKKQGKTYRLPTEAEWYRLVEISSLPDQPEWNVAPGNINLEHYCSPCPVDKFKTGDFYDLIGNVWQWTETPITGYAGFKVHPMYDDFSTPTFDGKHNLMKGGSWISTGNEATQHGRYAFRRHFYQHAGFRIVESEHPLTIENDEYETDLEVANMCENNWGDYIQNQSNFQKELAKLILEVTNESNYKNILDLNADTGRLAFELAPHFTHITAIDFSARFIRMPIQLQEKGFMRYIVKDEGELVLYREIVLSDKKREETKNKILFMQDNANNLKPNYTGFDVIVVPNLLEELTCPILFLKNIHERLNADGLLILASTYDWERNNIKREHWPGGLKVDGEPLTSFEGIKNILSSHFKLLVEPVNLPFELKINSRNSIVRNSEISVWKKYK